MTNRTFILAICKYLANSYIVNIKCNGNGYNLTPSSPTSLRIDCRLTSQYYCRTRVRIKNEQQSSTFNLMTCVFHLYNTPILILNDKVKNFTYNFFWIGNRNLFGGRQFEWGGERGGSSEYWPTFLNYSYFLLSYIFISWKYVDFNKIGRLC